VPSVPRRSGALHHSRAVQRAIARRAGKRREKRRQPAPRPRDVRRHHPDPVTRRRGASARTRPADPRVAMQRRGKTATRRHGETALRQRGPHRRHAASPRRVQRRPPVANRNRPLGRRAKAIACPSA
jgi:hypothetical protein